jgi:hypothetical protein
MARPVVKPNGLSAKSGRQVIGKLILALDQTGRTRVEKHGGHTEHNAHHLIRKLVVRHRPT